MAFFSGYFCAFPGCMLFLHIFSSVTFSSFEVFPVLWFSGRLPRASLGTAFFLGGGSERSRNGKAILLKALWELPTCGFFLVWDHLFFGPLNFLAGQNMPLIFYPQFFATVSRHTLAPRTPSDLPAGASRGHIFGSCFRCEVCDAQDIIHIETMPSRCPSES